jgi:hypothetical protein
VEGCEQRGAEDCAAEKGRDCLDGKVGEYIAVWDVCWG